MVHALQPVVIQLGYLWGHDHDLVVAVYRSHGLVTVKVKVVIAVTRILIVLFDTVPASGDIYLFKDTCNTFLMASNLCLRKNNNNVSMSVIDLKLCL